MEDGVNHYCKNVKCFFEGLILCLGKDTCCANLPYRSEVRVIVVVIGIQCPVNHTMSSQDSQTQVISKYTFLNSSHIYINPLSSQSTKPITSQT